MPSNFDIEKMTDIIDIKDIRPININYFEIGLALILLIIMLFLMWYVWKHFINKPILIDSDIQTDIYQIKQNQLKTLKEKLKNQYQHKMVEDFLLTATHILKLEKEIILKTHLLHTTTREFKDILQIYDTTLDQIDKFKFSKTDKDYSFIDDLYNKLKR